MGFFMLSFESVVAIVIFLLFISALILLIKKTKNSSQVLKEEVELKTRDIDEKNRALVASRRLNSIILQSLDFEEVVQKIADTIPRELYFGTGIVSIIDMKKRVIRRVAASQTKEAAEAIKVLRVPFKNIEISLDDPANIMARAVRERKSFMAYSVYDVLGPVISREDSTIVQKIMGTKTTLVYPIFGIGGRVIGIFLASTKRSANELSSYELEMIDDFSKSVGIAMEHAQIYNALKDANQKLQDLDKLKDDFVSIASHELRTPMTAIKSYLWMALNRGDVKLTEKMTRYLQRAFISTDRLINLVNDMLNVSRIESGRIEITPAPFDIGKLADEVVVEVLPKANEKSIQVEVIRTELPQVFADMDKVHQVLLNLLGNALKFTPAGGKITISFFTDGQVVETSVKDSGVGISKEDLSRLFQKFGRLDSSYIAAATTGGTGLGLYICKSLVEMMRGKIWATSEGLNKGTAFIFSLPIATPAVVAEAAKYAHTPTGEAKHLEPVAI